MFLISLKLSSSSSVCVYWAVRCARTLCTPTGYFYLVWCWFQEVCGGVCHFETRIPCTGYLTDFQGQYCNLMLIPYKSCVVSISLSFFFMVTQLVWLFMTVYTILFGTVTCRNLVWNICLFFGTTALTHASYIWHDSTVVGAWNWGWLACVILCCCGSGMLEWR